jgi:hypothetical protein
MCVERYLRLAAGSITLISLLLAQLVSGWFLLLTAFVGINLVQSAFTNWCPMMSILRALGVSECGKAPSSDRAAPSSLADPSVRVL